MLVAVVDDAASDFVYGPLGTPGRPDGVLDVAALASMDSGNLLGADDHNRWMQFLHVWQSAGWTSKALVQVTEELTPFQYGSDLELADLEGVQVEQLNCCIAKYCEIREQGCQKLTDFLAVIQANFSQRDSVLLLADDALARLSRVQIT